MYCHLNCNVAHGTLLLFLMIQTMLNDVLDRHIPLNKFKQQVSSKKQREVSSTKKSTKTKKIQKKAT